MHRGTTVDDADYDGHWIALMFFGPRPAVKFLEQLGDLFGEPNFHGGERLWAWAVLRRPAVAFASDYFGASSICFVHVRPALQKPRCCRRRAARP
jgi:hypothetical protein